MIWESALYPCFWFGPAVKITLGHPVEVVSSADMCNATLRAIESCNIVMCRRRVAQNMQDCNVVSRFVWVCQIM